MKKIFAILFLLLLVIKAFALRGDNLSVRIDDVYIPINSTQDINTSLAGDSNVSLLLYAESNDSSIVTIDNYDEGIALHSGNESNKTARITFYAVLAKRYGDNNATDTLKLVDGNLSIYLGGKEFDLLSDNWQIDNNETNLSSLMDINIPINNNFIGNSENSTKDYNTSLKLTISDSNVHQFIFQINSLILETVGNSIKLKLVPNITTIRLMQVGLQRLNNIISNNALYITTVVHSVSTDGLKIDIDTLKQSVNSIYYNKIDQIENILNSYYSAGGDYHIKFELTLGDNVSILTNLPVSEIQGNNKLFFDKNVNIGSSESNEPTEITNQIFSGSFLAHVVDNNTSSNTTTQNSDINITQILPVSPLILKKNFGEKIIPLAIYSESNNSITLSAESNDTSLLQVRIDGNNLVLNSVQDRTGMADVNITVGNNSTILRVYIMDIPNTTINIPAGWSLLSFPTKGKLDAMDLYDTFGNLDIKGIVKYNGGFWSYWDSDNEVKPQYHMPKFATLSSKEGFWIKANSSCEIRYPLDPNYNDPQDILRFQYYKNGWFLIGVNEDISPSSLASLIEQKSGKSVYLIYVYRNGEWKIYTPDSELDSRIRSDIPRIDGNILSKEGIWVLLR